MLLIDYYVNGIITASGFRAAMLNSRWSGCRRCATMRRTCSPWSETHNSDLESRLYVVCKRSYNYFRFCAAMLNSRRSDYRLIADVRRSSERARRGRKPLIPFWNRVSKLYGSGIITTSGFRADMLNSSWPDCRWCAAMTSFWRHLCKSGCRFRSGHFWYDRSITYRFWDICICTFPLAPYRCWSGVDDATVITS